MLKKGVILLLSVLSAAGAWEGRLEKEEGPTLLLVSLDGFRPDYLNRGFTPNLKRFGFLFPFDSFSFFFLWFSLSSLCLLFALCSSLVLASIFFSFLLFLFLSLSCFDRSLLTYPTLTNAPNQRKRESKRNLWSAPFPPKPFPTITPL